MNPTKKKNEIEAMKSGYTQERELVITESWQEHYLIWENLLDPVLCPINIHGHEIKLFVEAPRKGYKHSCTPEDLCKMLKLFPKKHLQLIELIVFRQVKEKEEALQSIWGRFVPNSQIQKFSGPCLYFEAVSVGQVLHWSGKTTPYHKKKLVLLEHDGYRIKKISRGYDIYTTPEALRNTQLFRTLPSEIASAVSNCLHSSKYSTEIKTEVESEYLLEIFDSKSTTEKENFVEGYAREFYKKYADEHQIPFAQIKNKETLKKLGLQPQWFY